MHTKKYDLNPKQLRFIAKVGFIALQHGFINHANDIFKDLTFLRPNNMVFAVGYHLCSFLAGDKNAFYDAQCIANNMDNIEDKQLSSLLVTLAETMKKNVRFRVKR